ncbi:MAG: CDP-alcohol phosphatidyltransferase family protein [Oscillospiraceae bacterium]|nr:CDP-alcohol phosphatidyltransferase family protein [Oscillospiraceae bacterium]
MIGFYDYTVILTYVSLFISVTGIFSACDGNLQEAVVCLMLSGFCDMFDGKIARTKKTRTKQEKRFGIQIDSLCDLVCFGVLPAVIGYNINQVSKLYVIVACGFVLAGLIRLAYYNVTEEERQDETDENRKYFKGLPITSSSLIIPLVYCLVRYAPIPNFSLLYTVALFVMAVAYITPLRIKKPHSVGMIVMALIGIVEFFLVPIDFTKFV